jgi:outer membrane protein OmpA-like peptidoglycan-associated protein
VKYYLKDNFEVFAGIFAEKRLTNSIREDKKYRRPYNTYTISFGIVYNFQLESKKTKKAVPEKDSNEELTTSSPDSEEEQLNDAISPIPEHLQEIEPETESVKENVLSDEAQKESESVNELKIDFSDEMFNNIELETGKNELTDVSVKQLIELSKALKDHPEAKLQIDAYTDNVGTNQANLILSKKRADRVAQVLIQNGISADQLVVNNHGESNPIGDNATEAGRKKNRRVELTLIH